MMSFENQVRALIEDTRKFCKNHSDRMVSEYKKEKSTAKEYKGREILELIQNADDAKSDSILLSLDTKRNTLTIANQGDPFTIQGVRSLMIPNLSPKIKKSYIGNKGLGFRAILNWAVNINVKCNGVALEFSEEIVKEEFKTIFEDKTRERILQEWEFKKKVIPIPILAIPKVDKESETNNDWTTKIEIKFDPSIINQIEKQIKELRDEVLLFLNNINSIRIKGATEKMIQREPIGNGFRIAEKKWKIYSEENELPKKYQDKDQQEKEHYSLKLALQDDLTDNVNVLFNYLPTKVNVDFPMVIHGTFELDDSRNQLIESDKNEFVLDKLIDLIIATAKKIKETGRIEATWNPLRLLIYKNTNKVLEDLSFYNKIEDKKDNLEIYPCLDDQYRLKKDVYFYSNAFSEFIIASKQTRLFPEILKPIPKGIPTDDIIFSQYQDSVFAEKIDALSRELKTIEQRAELIYLLSSDSIFARENRKYALLTNQKNKLISKDTVVYTPKTKDEAKFPLPDFIKLDFINNSLYEKLLEKFELESSHGQARELQRKIRSIINIQSYEPVPVLEKIITGTRGEIKKYPKRKQEFVISMIQSLFHIRKNNLDEKTKLPENVKVDIINKNGALANIKLCYLSKDYPSGELTEDIFDNIYKRSEFIANRKKFKLQDEDPQEVEDFFIWMGVNKHTQFEKLKNPVDYQDFIFKKIEKPAGYHEGETEVSTIKDFGVIIEKLSREKAVLWILKDNFIKQQFDLSGNQDNLRWKKKSEWYFHYSIHNKPSYILYQFHRTELFKDFIIDDYNVPFLNPFEFNFNHPLYAKYGVQRRDIENIVLKIGAKESFESISIDRVMNILKNLPETNHDGRFTQKIYRLSLEHYKRNKSELPEKDFPLYAQNGSSGKYEPNSVVYYSDNITLPKKIIDSKPLLNLPPRSGEDQISKFFRTKTFKDITLKIKKPIEINKSLTDNFSTEFKKILPYLFCFRLNKINSQKQKEKEAKTLKGIGINIYHKCHYTTGASKLEPLEINDFINEGSNFHIRAKDVDVNGLKSDSGFCDAFAEIMCIVLNVNDHRNEFRFAFKNDRKDTEHSILHDLGSEILDEAKQLMGVSNYERNFWHTIFMLKQIEIEGIRDTDHIIEIAQTKLNLNITDCLNYIDFEDLSNKSNYEYLKELFNILRLSPADFNIISEMEINLTNYHLEKIRMAMLNYENDFKNILWHKLSKNRNEQELFLNKIFSFTKDYPEYLTEELNKYNTLFECPYAEIINDYARSIFSINLDDPIEAKDYESILKSNLKKIGCEKEDLSNKHISLLCFDGNIDVVKSDLENETQTENDDTGSGNDEPNDNELQVSVSSLKKPVSTNTGKKKRKGSGGTYSAKRDRENNKKGELAEKKTYAHLLKEYGEDNVVWVSKYSRKADADDEAGYDMRYKHQSGVWKYVEVKYVSSNYFFLSKSEKEFGLEHKENYELALMKDGTIHFIKDFLIFEHQQETFENNTKYKIQENDYLVYFELKQDDEGDNSPATSDKAHTFASR
ncbi:protein of unknown function [Algoriphagus hitonicola]|uniref:Protein NO VEIN C-terminal domain-containing protein n=2 Tax=Algoriphagus hitonicola TaxID=435880 RepID=A0A1I2XCQ7_9BACT|nr:protein of unknown function [Algoriphagus hitonicola]